MITAINGLLWHYLSSNPSVGGNVAFLQSDGWAGNTDSFGSFSFTQTISSPLTNGYILLSSRLNTATTSGDNIAATFAGTGMTPIPVSGGFSGISYNTNRSIHVRGLPVGSLGTGIYTITFKVSGVGTIGITSDSTVYNNVSQTIPTGAITCSGSAFTTTRKAYVDLANGDMAIGIYGNINNTNMSGVGPGQTIVFDSGNNNILSVFINSGTAPNITLQGWTTGAGTSILLGLPLRKA